jgi:hypothetical protein
METDDAAMRPSSAAMATPPPSLWSFKSIRMGIAIVLALSLAIEGLMRSNINMAMVCMVNKTALAMMAEMEAFNTTTLDNAQQSSRRSKVPLVPIECQQMEMDNSRYRQQQTKDDWDNSNNATNSNTSTPKWNGSFTIQEEASVDNYV